MQTSKKTYKILSIVLLVSVLIQSCGNFNTSQETKQFTLISETSASKIDPLTENVSKITGDEKLEKPVEITDKHKRREFVESKRNAQENKVIIADQGLYGGIESGKKEEESKEKEESEKEEKGVDVREYSKVLLKDNSGEAKVQYKLGLRAYETWQKNKVKDTLATAKDCLRSAWKGGYEKAGYLLIEVLILVNQVNCRLRFNLNDIQIDESLTIDEQIALIKWCMEEIKQGNTELQNSLGVMYEFGIGIGRDTEKAIECYTQAAQKFNSDAAYNLGNIYEFKMEGQKAITWYTSAASYGDTEAMYKLGKIYEYGLANVEKCEVHAIYWYTKAITQPNPYFKASRRLNELRPELELVNE